MPEDDRELMLQVRGGSRAAFSALVRSYQGRLLSFFLRKFGDQELAEDCAQEVFVRVYTARDRYTPDASFATFLFTIARNYSIDVSRSRRIRRDVTVTGPAAEDEEGEDRLSRLPSAETTPLAQVTLADDLGRLRHALTGLPETLRDVVQLGVIEALPYAEVSAILAIPIGTVKSRVHAAVQALRTLLLEEPSAAVTAARRRATGNRNGRHAEGEEA